MFKLVFSVFHIIAVKNVNADIISAKYGSFLLNQDLCGGKIMRDIKIEKNISTALYSKSIVKPVIMPSKYQQFLLSVSINIIKINNADIQKRAKREFDRVTTDPKSENADRTFSNNSPTKAVLSL
jgi:hypothetical protein